MSNVSQLQVTFRDNPVSLNAFLCSNDQSLQLLIQKGNSHFLQSKEDIRLITSIGDFRDIFVSVLYETNSTYKITFIPNEIPRFYNSRVK